MVVRHIVGALCLLGMLDACDVFYGPKITNAFGFDVVAVVDDNSGQSLTFDWPACQTTFFGSRNRMIQRIVFKREGTILRTLTTAEVQDVVNDLKASPGTAKWLVDESGIHRFPRNATTTCVDKH